MVRKTFFFSSLLIVLVTLISFAILYFAMPGYYLLKKEQVLQTNLNRLTMELRQADTTEDCAALIAAFVADNNVTALAFGSEGAVVAELSSPLVSMASGTIEEDTYWIAYSRDTGSEQNNSPVITIAISNDISISEGTASEARQSTFISHSTIGDVISLTNPVGTELLGQISVTGTLQPIDEAKGVILSLIPYALAIGIVLGLLVSWLYARQISKPILQISAATVRMQRLEPQAFSGIRSHDELGLLSSNLDALYASLRENIGQLRQEMDKVNRLERSKTEMMQSASHELKTPIAALSGMLDGMIDNIGVYHDKEKYLRECKGQVDKLSLLVAEILNASKADSAGEAFEPTETAIDALVAQALADYARPMEEKGLQLVTELCPVTITTDPSALFRVIGNLIGNAARHTPPGGEVRVTLNTERLSIENHCVPIPAGETPKLFEPFYTTSYNRDKAESGAGLGLYIVKRNLERLNIPYGAESTETGLKISLIWQ